MEEQTGAGAFYYYFRLPYRMLFLEKHTNKLCIAAQSPRLANIKVVRLNEQVEVIEIISTM